MKNEAFIQSRLIDQSQELLDAKFYFPAFLVVSQGIETLGAFLDKKPLSAKFQSKKRFHLALEQLFDKNYQTLSKDGWLYKQLRCNMTHLSHSGAFILLCSKKETNQTHLELSENRRIFVVESFVADFQAACCRLIVQLAAGEISQKKLPGPQIQ